MTISFQLPPAVEQTLARPGVDPSDEFKEAGLVEMYRLGRISHGQLAEGLGISRAEADTILRRHNVTDDLLTPLELDAQLSRLRPLVG
ncbi:MAG: UPF0175 family protein [Phycisphaerales bacterium]